MCIFAQLVGSESAGLEGKRFTLRGWRDEVVPKAPLQNNTRLSPFPVGSCSRTIVTSAGRSHVQHADVCPRGGVWDAALARPKACDGIAHHLLDYMLSTAALVTSNDDIAVLVVRMQN